MTESGLDMNEVIPFFVVGKDDVVIQVGTSQRSHLKDNAVPGKLYTGTAPHGRYKYLNGKFVEYSPQVPYDQARRIDYPSVEDQMDMLWHAMSVGTLEKVEPFYSSIKAVKDKYPKTAE